MTSRESMLETARDYADPCVRQIAVFLSNHVGSLSDVLAHLESEEVLCHALAINNNVDFAIIRLIVDKYESACRVLETDFQIAESKLVAVELPDPNIGLLKISRALLRAEISINYSYPMFTQVNQRPVVLLHLDDLTTGCEILRKTGYSLIDEIDLAL